MITEYKALMEAAKVLDKIRYSIFLEDDGTGSPAWQMLEHARRHVMSLANDLLRSES
jgi:hypothetical protein